METLSEAIRRLEDVGYCEAFRATREGLLASPSGKRYAPESMVVEEVLRFEGPSDPADESALFALRGADGVRGTWVIAFGPPTGALDAEMAHRLKRPR